MPISIPGRFNRLLQKFLSTKGGALITDVGGEIISVFPFFFGREVRFLEGWETFAVNMSVAGVAANLSSVRLRNPPSSNVVAVLEKVACFSTTAGDNPMLTMGSPAAADLAIAGTSPVGLDVRGRAIGTCIVSGKNSNAVLNGSNVLRGAYNAPNTPYEFLNTDSQELPLLPNEFYEISSEIVNQNIFVSWLWRERALEDSELR